MTERVRARGANGYFMGFGLTAVMLGGATLFLVLFVFPRRYVLDSGLRESGLSYPAQAAPFVPPADVIREPAPQPAPPTETAPGPAQVFWGNVGSLVSAGRYVKALPLFQRWLADHPDDWDVRREYALTLQHAGRSPEAVSVLAGLVAVRDDPETRLLLARGLRDLGRIEEASAQYALLEGRTADHGALALEWARALAWAQKYDEAAEVLEGAMEEEPDAVDLRVELARVSYWSGHLDRATELLAGLDEATLERWGGDLLREEVRTATTPEEAEAALAAEDPAPTAVDRARTAASQRDFEAAAALYREALRRTPGDTAIWRAYADVLQFGLDDMQGARDALLRIEKLGGVDPRMELRLAQLAIWTGRNDDARWRLRGLLTEAGTTDAADPQGGPEVLSPDQVSEVWALLGDLRRWDGDRVGSGDAYTSALGLDSTNVRAHGGLEELAAVTEREVADQERPRLGGDAYVIVDSDHFSRVDVGATGVRFSGSRVWAIRTGSRWLGGSDLVGSLQNQRRLFFDVESARWWRWGTVRTGLHFGIEQAGPGSSDLSFGGSLRFADLGGFRTDVTYEHGPAYALTSTLQSVLAGVTQDRVTANVSRRLGARWSLSAMGDAAWLRAGMPDNPPGSWRFEGALSLGKSVTDELVLGVNMRGAAYTAPAPVENGLRLFWDPRALAAGGVYAQWDKALEDGWSLGLRLNPSLAFIDERNRPGFQAVPHGSAEMGLTHKGSRFETSLNGFYYQGRFDGYRAYGLRLSFSATDWLLGGRRTR